MGSASTAVNTRNTQNYRRRKRLMGVCYEGGCWEPILSTAYCALHLEQYKLRIQALRERKKGDGIHDE